MEILAALGALAPLLAALLEAWIRHAPARRRKELTDGYERDVQAVDRAVAETDAAALTEAFERERRAGVRDRGVDPRGPGDDAGLRAPGADGPAGGPRDPGAA